MLDCAARICFEARLYELAAGERLAFPWAGFEEWDARRIAKCSTAKSHLAVGAPVEHGVLKTLLSFLLFSFVLLSSAPAHTTTRPRSTSRVVSVQPAIAVHPLVLLLSCDGRLRWIGYVQQGVELGQMAVRKGRERDHEARNGIIYSSGSMSWK